MTMSKMGAGKEKIQTLISDFTCLSEEEKIFFLLSCIRQCKLPQIQLLHEEAERILATDFVDILPLELTEKIFSYLDATSLCRASCVNNRWRAASNNDSLWSHICERKQWMSLCYNKALQRKPEVLMQPTSTSRRTIITSHKPYDFCIETSVAFPLKGVCKWKDHYVRVSHLERNWVNGLYIVKPVLRGHTQPVTCMDCNGDTIVSGSLDSTVRIWDALNCECVATLSQFTGSVKCLQLKGSTLVTGCADNIIRIFDVKDCKMVRELHGHESSVDHICFDENVIASASSTDRMIKLWSVDDGSCIHTLAGHTDDIEVLKLRDSMLVSASWDERVLVWDVKTGERLHSLRGHSEVVMCCQMDDVKLTTGGADGLIIIWDLQHGHLRQTLYGLAEVYCLEFNDEIIASGYADSTVRIWSIHGDLRYILDGHIGIVRCIRLQGTRLISGGDCKRVIVWDTESGELTYVVHRHPTALHLMWVDETRIITASPEAPGTITVLSYWA